MVDRLEDINKSCLEEFRKHWECLDNNNQQLWQCRKMERGLNKCVFDKLVSLQSSLWADIAWEVSPCANIFAVGTREDNTRCASE